MYEFFCLGFALKFITVCEDKFVVANFHLLSFLHHWITTSLGGSKQTCASAKRQKRGREGRRPAYPFRQQSQLCSLALLDTVVCGFIKFWTHNLYGKP